MILSILASALVGLWVTAGQEPDACASDEARRYRADGRYADLWERGRWSLRDGVLVETTTQRTVAAERPGPTRETHRYRAVFEGRHRLRLTSRAGITVVLARCR